MSNLNKILTACLVIIAGLVGLNLYSQNDFTEIDSKILQVAFLDVGQGDSILIRTPEEQNVLIDGGPDDSVLYELDQIVPFYDRNIDVMVLTHPHADHVDGLVELVKDYEVQEIYYTGVSHTAPGYIEWLELIQQKQIPLNIVTQPMALDFGNHIKLEFLYPANQDFTGIEVENLNNTSIVNRLTYGNVSFLFTGDAEIEQEMDLLETQADLSAEILKAGHHGSNTATSDELLEAVGPQYVVIQSGTDNKFGHPHYRTLDRVNEYGAQVLRNDELGTIIFETDGETINIQ